MLGFPPDQIDPHGIAFVAACSIIPADATTADGDGHPPS